MILLDSNAFLSIESFVITFIFKSTPHDLHMLSIFRVSAGNAVLYCICSESENKEVVDK